MYNGIETMGILNQQNKMFKINKYICGRDRILVDLPTHSDRIRRCHMPSISSVVNLLGYHASSQVMIIIEFVHPSTGNELIFLCWNDSHDAIWTPSIWNINHIPELYCGFQPEYLCQGCFHVLWKKETNMKSVSTKGLKCPSFVCHLWWLFRLHLDLKML